MTQATFRLSYEDAVALLEVRNPDLLERLRKEGYRHAEHMLRHIDGETAARIQSGDLSDREKNDSFYLERHAACVIAAEMAPHA